MAEKLDPIGKSSTGMEENIAALIAVLVAPVTSVIFFLLEKDSKFVKFHAMQSGIIGAIYLALWILKAVPVIGFITGILVFLLSLPVFVLWVILLIKAFNGEWLILPIVGNIAMEQVEK